MHCEQALTDYVTEQRIGDVKVAGVDLSVRGQDSSVRPEWLEWERVAEEREDNEIPRLRFAALGMTCGREKGGAGMIGGGRPGGGGGRPQGSPLREERDGRRDGSPHPRGQREGGNARGRLGGEGRFASHPYWGECCRARGSPPSPVFTRAGSNLPPSRGKGFVGDGWARW